MDQTTDDYQAFRAMLADPVARKQLFEMVEWPVPTDAQAADLLRLEGRCHMLHAEVTGALQSQVAARVQKAHRSAFWGWLVLIVGGVILAAIFLPRFLGYLS